MEALGLTPEFWRGRRVLLTGHTGFKGAWLSLWLQALGAEVTGFALAPATEPNLFSLIHPDNAPWDRRGDIRDGAALAEVVAECRPEIVLHLAAQALVSRGYEDPVTTYSSNVMGTLALLEAIRHHGGVRALVVVTTDKVYENREPQTGYGEHDPLGGHDPYSASKACVELLTRSYADSFFPRAVHGEHATAIATARAGNVIGGGDFAPMRLVPDVLAAWAQGRSVSLRNPDAIRPWQHVLEPLAGYLILAERLFQEPELAGPYNFGPEPGDEWRVSELVAALQALVPGASACRNQAISMHETRALRLNSRKAWESLGWRPRWNLPRALRETVAWWQAWRSGEAMRDVCLAQIREYGSAASGPTLS